MLGPKRFRDIDGQSLVHVKTVDSYAILYSRQYIFIQTGTIGIFIPLPGPMDHGWDIPQSGSGAGSINQESSFFQDSTDWDPLNPYDAWDNSNEHEAFWGAANNNINQKEEVFGTHENSTFATDLKPGEIMNAKTPPTYDQSTMTWFMFEEYVRDWEEITQVLVEQRGPLLRNRLRGYPATFKRIFNRDKLCQPDGVTYFMKTLKGEFIRDAPRVFMWRLLRFIRLRRGKEDIISWLTRYNLEFERLSGSWDDFRDLDLEYTEDNNTVCTMPEEQQAKVRAYIMTLPVNERPMLRLENQDVWSIWKKQYRCTISTPRTLTMLSFHSKRSFKHCSLPFNLICQVNIYEPCFREVFTKN